MDRAKSRALQSGIAALARAIEGADGDYEEAERAFLAAAAETVRDPYPRFCLSAIGELRGDRPVRQEPPDGWAEAVSLLAGARLREARGAFERFRALDPPYSYRAELYQRLIDQLAPHLSPRDASPPPGHTP